MSTVRLSESPPLSVSEIREIGLSLAREVAELHRRNVVHGHIRPSRVRIGEGGASLDRPDGDGFSKPHDVRSLGELLLWLFSRNDLPASGPLAEVARAAAALDPASRPTAEELVVRLEGVDASQVALPERQPGLGLRRRAALVSIAACAAVGVVAVGALAWVQRGEGDPAAPAKRAVPMTAVAASDDRLPAQVWPDAMRACADATGPLVADLDEDGCEETIAVRGAQLVGDVGTVAIAGSAVEHHVTGDWYCVGRSTLAVLQSGTDVVFVFPAWARPGRTVEAIAAAQVAGATSLVSGDVDGDGCDDLRVVTGDGEVPVEVPRAVGP